MFRRFIASAVCFTFIFSNFQYVHAQDFSINQLPAPGTMVGLSSPFAPLALKGIVVDLQKPLEFQFIVDTGKGPQNTTAIKEEANRLVKYFLAGLTIPEGDLWVNLSPYEKDRMVPDALGQTDLGRDLLAQDYILKQLTASLIYPEKDLGKEFWAKVYKKAQEQFGTTNIPVNTFNKVWILPDQAQVFENKNAAYVTKSTLKVMLDEDYLALAKHQGQPGDMSPKGDVSPSTLPSKTGLNAKAPQGQPTNALASQIVREIILPEIEKEVNTGTNFAPLRQIYQALILAKWYKETVKNALLEAVYLNQNKTAGVNLDDPAVKEQIYNRYLQAYKKGVFNYIKEDPTPDGQSIPRKYFSGGITKLEPEHIDRSGRQADVKGDGAMVALKVQLAKDSAMLNQKPTKETFDWEQTRNSITRIEKDRLRDSPLLTYDERRAIVLVQDHNILAGPGVDETEDETARRMEEDRFLINDYDDALKKLEEISKPKVDELIKRMRDNFDSVVEGKKVSVPVKYGAYPIIDRGIAKAFGYSFKDSAMIISEDGIGQYLRTEHPSPDQFEEWLYQEASGVSYTRHDLEVVEDLSGVDMYSRFGTKMSTKEYWHEGDVQDIITFIVHLDDKKIGVVFDAAMLGQMPPEMKQKLVSGYQAVGLNRMAERIQQDVFNAEQGQLLDVLLRKGQKQLFENWEDDPLGFEDKEKRGMLDELLGLEDGILKEFGGIEGYIDLEASLAKRAQENFDPTKGKAVTTPEGVKLTTINKEYFEKGKEGLAYLNRIAFQKVAAGGAQRLNWPGPQANLPYDVLAQGERGGKSFIQEDIENIIALQEQYKKSTGEQVHVPYVLYLGQEHIEQVVQWLKDNDYFGMDGVSVVDPNERIKPGQELKQIVLTWQTKALGFKDSKLTKDDKHILNYQPLGHGWVHPDFGKIGLTEYLTQKLGPEARTIFFQASNPLVWNGIMQAVNEAFSRDDDLNVTAVSVMPGEPVGRLVLADNEPTNVEYNYFNPEFSENKSMPPQRLVEAIKTGGKIDVPAESTPVKSLNKLLEKPGLYKAMNKWPDGSQDFINRLEKGERLRPLEVKKLNRLLLEANYPEETPKSLKERIDSEGNSEYGGNINVFIVKNAPYAQVVNDEGNWVKVSGQKVSKIFAWLYNPKPDKIIRPETNMQDIYRFFKKVGVTVLDRFFVFAAVKNDLVEAQKAVAKGVFPEDTMSVLGMKWRAFRRILAGSGLKFTDPIEGEKKKLFFKEGFTRLDKGKDDMGTEWYDGAKFSINPQWGYTFTGEKNVATKNAALVLDNVSKSGVGDRSVEFKNVAFDGTVTIRSVPGVSLLVHDVNFGTKDQQGRPTTWHFEPLSLEQILAKEKQQYTYIDPLTGEVKTQDVAPVEQKSGYVLIKDGPGWVFKINEPGNYEIGSDGQLKKLDQPMTQDINGKPNDSAMLGQMPPSQDAAMNVPALKKLAALKEDWGKPEHNIRTSLRDEGLAALHELNAMAEKIVLQKRVTPEMIDQVAEWASFDTGSGGDHHEEYVRDEAVSILDKIATDPDSQLRAALVVLGNTSDPVITAWVDKKFATSPREKAIALLRTKLSLPGLVSKAAKEALKKLGADQAMLQTPARQITKDKAALAKDLGGIDLNQINVNREGKAVVVQFDPAQLNELMRDGFEGFMPVIINITPIQSPLPLLGVNPRKEGSLEVAAAAS